MSQTQATHSNSISGQDSNNGEKDKKAKSRKPASMLGTLFYDDAVDQGLRVQEIVIDYSDCARDAPSGDDGKSFASLDPKKVKSSFTHGNSTVQPPMWKRSTTNVTYAPGVTLDTTLCSITFTLPEDLKPPILLYYRLTNFYQNHRRYVKSLDSDQLKGTAKSAGQIKGGSCDPLRLDENNKPYYPCGLIANSLFNDTFHNPVLLNPKSSDGTNGNNKTYPMYRQGIAWPSDKALYGPTKYKLDEIAVPPNWQKRWPNGYTEDNPPPSLVDDEPFQVWMRTAGLPSFSKLALRNDNQTMERGNYQVDIELNFPVTVYGGTKSLVITTTTVMGGKNPFLGIAYVVVGGICVVLGALFTITHLIKP
ncbi:hypothetical protein GP486_008106, partial [Trichoglossum hirsutum]